jgi:predicted small secreted protein
MLLPSRDGNAMLGRASAKRKTLEMNMSLLKRVFAVVMLAAFLVTVPACNTMEGAGKDIKKGGEKIEDAAK